MNFKDMLEFSRELFPAGDDRTAFQLFEAQSERLSSHGLFTVLRIDHAANAMIRLYSSREDVSLTGGTKPMPNDVWAERVIFAGRPFIGRTREDLKEVFFDYDSSGRSAAKAV